MKQIVALIALAVGVGLEATAQTTDADALSRARSVGNSARSQKVFYQKEFDLSGLPVYDPSREVEGNISLWGNNYVADSGLLDVWKEEFTSFHPDVTFDERLYSSSVGFPGLIAGTADLALMGRQALWDELKGVERTVAGDASLEADTPELVEIVMATGSYNVRGWTFALGVFVNEDNPIECLSMDQLDGIFGAERDGGWDGLTWRTDLARTAEGNIRTWGDVGLSGEWSGRGITVYGYNSKYHFNDEIDKKVLKGSGKWVESMRAYSNVAGLKADGSLTAGGELIMNGLAGDVGGIAYTGVPFLNSGTKAIALAPNEGGACIPLTLDTVQDRTYPLIRDVYIYFLRSEARPLSEPAEEFMKYILSQQGQAAIQRDGKYLPLTEEAAKEQLQKLLPPGNSRQGAAEDCP